MAEVIGAVLAVLAAGAIVLMAWRSRPPGKKLTVHRLGRLRERFSGWRRERQPATVDSPPGWIDTAQGGPSVELPADESPDIQRTAVESAGQRAAGPATAATAPIPAGRAVSALHVPGTGGAQLSVVAVTLSDSSHDRDSYVVQQGLVGVAQGTNSTAIGQGAAALALSAIIAARLRQAPNAEAALEAGVSSANRTIRAVAQRDPTLAGMTTTLDIVLLDTAETTPAIVIAHVGNGTVWLQRPEASPLDQLTTPHAYGDGPLLRAIGLAPDLCPDVRRVPVQAGDRVILATDSLTRTLGLPLVETMLREYAGSPAAACLDALTAEAAAHKMADSATVAVADVVSGRVVSAQVAVPVRGGHGDPS